MSHFDKGCLAQIQHWTLWPELGYPAFMRTKKTFLEYQFMILHILCPPGAHDSEMHHRSIHGHIVFPFHILVIAQSSTNIWTTVC